MIRQTMKYVTAVYRSLLTYRGESWISPTVYCSVGFPLMLEYMVMARLTLLLKPALSRISRR